MACVWSSLKQPILLAKFFVMGRGVRAGEYTASAALASPSLVSFDSTPRKHVCCYLAINQSLIALICYRSLLLILVSLVILFVIIVISDNMASYSNNEYADIMFYRWKRGCGSARIPTPLSRSSTSPRYCFREHLSTIVWNWQCSESTIQRWQTSTVHGWRRGHHSSVFYWWPKHLNEHCCKTARYVPVESVVGSTSIRYTPVPLSTCPNIARGRSCQATRIFSVYVKRWCWPGTFPKKYFVDWRVKVWPGWYNELP